MYPIITMNNNKKCDLKQSLLSAISTFSYAVSTPEIISVANASLSLNSNGNIKLSRNEAEALLKKMTLDGEVLTFPVNRFRCHHVWHGTTKPEEARCSRCGRVTTFQEVENLDSEEIYYFLQQRPDYVPEVVIAAELGLELPKVRKYLKEMGSRVENDDDGNWRSIAYSPVREVAVEAEVVVEAEDELSNEEQQELLRLETTIDKGAQAFYEMGKAFLTIREQRLYRGGFESFEAYCQKRFGITRRNVNYLISAAKIVNNLKNLHNCAKNENSQGNNCSQTVPSLVLPSSESQVRSLAKLEPEEQVEIWIEAIEQSDGNIPTGKKVQELVRKKKIMKRKLKAEETQTDRFSVKDVVRVTAKYNSDLKEFHQHWAIVEKVEEFGYTIRTYKGRMSGVLHDDLMLIKRSSYQAAIAMIGKMEKALDHYSQDPDLMAFLQYQATKPNPGASHWADVVLNCSVTP